MGEWVVVLVSASVTVVMSACVTVGVSEWVGGSGRDTHPEALT